MDVVSNQLLRSTEAAMRCASMFSGVMLDCRVEEAHRVSVVKQRGAHKGGLREKQPVG